MLNTNLRSILLSLTSGLLTIVASESALAEPVEWVTVGSFGNAADTRYEAAGIGAVPYTYQISKYEVTDSQYAQFLNAKDPTGTNKLGLYNSFMTTDASGGIEYNSLAPDGSKYVVKSGRDSSPVNFVSWYDAVRFTNWMNNGQGSGDTENGAYTLLGGTPVPSNGASVIRNPGALVWLPNMDEWYKAAYYDPAAGHYWDYPTGTNDKPYSVPPPGTAAPVPANTANWFNDDGLANGFNGGFAVNGTTTIDVPNENGLTDVGAYLLAASQFGTFDQGGNVWEWTENLSTSGNERLQAGGSYADGYSDYMIALQQGVGQPPDAANNSAFGFRIASVPEPSSLSLLVLGMLIGALTLRRRVG